MEVIHSRCAGMDVSKRDAKVCVRVAGAGRRRSVETVTTWGATTNRILALRDHLVAEQVSLVVMEATGAYWKPFYFLLEDAGFEVRDVESLREHYALTLRAWCANLDRSWDAALAASTSARARVWRLYMTASAMSFEFGPYRFNLVDTPGHSDFSEDTYRTLTAVDAAIMVIDGAKGVESQTRKLFEVCRLRDLPILTFCNKMDRESRDTFEIIDEIQENLAIDVAPVSWPIGMGRDFIGAYDLLNDRLEIMDRADRNKVAETVQISGLDDPKLAEHVPADLLEKLPR